MHKEHSTRYKMCSKTVMDTTANDIEFDNDGISNYYWKGKELLQNMLLSSDKKAIERNKLVEKIKNKGKNKEYDCLIGISGGVDSSYVAFMAKKLGLRPLAVHLDGGWNSELAVKNIENLLRKLDIDLITYVLDWEEMKNLQVSFLKASVANQDVPQDHAIIASLYKVAREKNINYILGGHNLATESILPFEWGYNALDRKQLKGIHKKFGKVKLKNYPTIGYLYHYFFAKYISNIHFIKILNFLDYNKAEAMKLLEDELEWRYYGGKHYESRFTKFFQSYYLPTKFGFDKRKAHLSSLIISNQISRKDALDELEKPLYDKKEMQEDIEFVIKKLGLNRKEFDSIMGAPNKTFRDYPSNYKLYVFLKKIFKR